MTQNNNVYVIAAGDKQIWAINPKTKQRLRIKLAKDISKIFDIYANNSVEPDVKYKTINEEADGSEVKGTLTTGPVLTAPADFNIWLRLEIE